MYDFAHPLSDAIEGITHSLCTLEFEDHRPLYDWLVDSLTDAGDQPQQIEFARLNLNYTVMSKRKLLQLVRAGARRAAGTIRACRRIAGLRRRGYTPEAIRDFLRAHRRRQDARTSSTSRCSSTASARISTAARRA